MCTRPPPCTRACLGLSGLPFPLCILGTCQRPGLRAHQLALLRADPLGRARVPLSWGRPFPPVSGKSSFIIYGRRLTRPLAAQREAHVVKRLRPLAAFRSSRRKLCPQGTWIWSTYIWIKIQRKQRSVRRGRRKRRQKRSPRGAGKALRGVHTSRSGRGVARRVIRPVFCANVWAHPCACTPGRQFYTSHARTTRVHPRTCTQGPPWGLDCCPASALAPIIPGVHTPGPPGSCVLLVAKRCPFQRRCWPWTQSHHGHHVSC